MQVTLELVKYEEDESIFLNFWDNINCNDICTEIIDGNIFLDANEENKMPISLQQFINMVEKVVLNSDLSPIQKTI